MKKAATIALILIMAGLGSARAMTLDGSVEKTETVKKKSFWARLFEPAPEGRIGIRISESGHIEYVHPGSPAETVGLQKRDTVLTVDGCKHAVEDISGEPGSTVHLEVKRGDDQFAIDVERIDCHLIQH